MLVDFPEPMLNVSSVGFFNKDEMASAIIFYINEIIFWIWSFNIGNFLFFMELIKEGINEASFWPGPYT